MEPTPELIDALFVDKVMAARRGSFEQKFNVGGSLFVMAMQWMKMGIRMQNPGATDEQVAREVQRRLAIGRLLEKTV